MANPLKGLTIAPLVLFVLGAAGVVSAQTAPPAQAPRPERGPMAHRPATPYRPLLMELRGVKLTPDQRQQVIAVVKAHRPDLKAVQEKLRAARAEWQQAGKIDIEQRKSLNQERMAVLQAARTEISNVLTPEQKAQIAARRGRRQLR
jgi:Spy/CpxP family protein refolding chaperone